MNEQQVTSLVLLDLMISAAFDTIDQVWRLFRPAFVPY